MLKSYTLFSYSLILLWVSLTLTWKVEGQKGNHCCYTYSVQVLDHQNNDSWSKSLNNITSPGVIGNVGCSSYWQLSPSSVAVGCFFWVCQSCIGFLFSGILWQCVTYVKCRESFSFIEVEGPDIEYYIPFDKYV